jgi:hypothetical protein
MPLLPPIAFDLSHRHALDAERGERFAHFVELEGFDDRRDKLHLPSFRVVARAGPIPKEGGPALTIYQEAGQLPGDSLRHWKQWCFDRKSAAHDSKTGRGICLENKQKPVFACFLSAIEAEL